MNRREGPGPSRRKRLDQRLAQAVRAQQAGDLVRAEQGMRAVIEADPHDSAALHHLALLRHRCGARDEAIALLERAAAVHGADAALVNNLGNMLREAGRTDEAIAAYRRALTLDAHNLNTGFNLAYLLLDRGDAQEARRRFEQLLAAVPGDVSVLNGLGVALMMQGEAAAAVAHLSDAVVRAPDDPASHANLARALLASDRPEDALGAAARAVELAPQVPQALHLLGTVQLALERFKEAESVFRKLVTRDPGDLEAYPGLVRSLVEQRREDEALAVCDAAIARAPDAAEPHADRGAVLKQMGRLDESVSAFERALERAPQFVDAHNNLGMTLLDRGDTARAQACFERALELAPDLPEALLNVVRTRKNREEHRGDIERMRLLAERDGHSLAERVSLHFGLGKAYDDLGEFDRAFEHYARANALKRRTVRFNPAHFLDWVQGFHETFTGAFFERTKGFGVGSERPVFIVGMPRSGTTLVEQILASHPQVHGADELPLIGTLSDELPALFDAAQTYPRAASRLDATTAADFAQRYLAFIDALDARAARVTDKMPTNFFHLGLIAAMFPNAHVIHCRRDPMDTCFSSFIQQFGAGHFYSYSLDDIATYYREYERLMAHWRSVLPLSMHEVVYETLVEEQERVSREMVASIGLEWDEACLAFHRTERAVRTASHWQVRQPIYRSARQRWRNYAGHLEGLREAIGYVDPAAH